MAPHIRLPRDDFRESFSVPLLSEDDYDGDIVERRRACLRLNSSSASTSASTTASSSSSSSSSPSCFGLKGEPVSRNVTLIFVYTWFAFVGRGIWNQNVLATLVFLLRSGDATSVGYITAAMGMCQLLISIPTGILADKYRRDTLLKGAAVLGVAAVSISIMASLGTNYVSLVVALCMWGAFFGVVDTALTALLADSVAEKRSYYFTQRSVIISVANMCGPLVALIMFAVIGDEWTIQGCSIVFLVGNLICLPAVILLCFLSDDATAVQQYNDEDEFTVADPHSDDTSSHDNDDDDDDDGHDDDDDDDVEESMASLLEQPLRWRSGAATLRNCHKPRLCGTSSSTEKENQQDETYDAERLGDLLVCFPKTRVVPILVALADVSSGLASGMSVRYFAIFLYDNLKLDPVHVQVLYMVAPALQIGLQKYAQRLGSIYGRCSATVWLKWIGILLMFTMVAAFKQGLSRWIICTMFVFRTAFMNSPAALTKSVLMDSVPKAERAKWASLESVNMFSWSGSAFLGGILVEHFGILSNFTVTAGLQFVATLPLLLLSFYGKQEEDEETTTTDLSSADDDSDRSEDHDGV